MTKNFYQNVTFFLALNSFFAYFKTQERLLYYMLHMQINLKTWEIKVLCCNTYILGMQFNPTHRDTATNPRKLPSCKDFSNHFSMSGYRQKRSVLNLVFETQFSGKKTSEMLLLSKNIFINANATCGFSIISSFYFFIYLLRIPSSSSRADHPKSLAMVVIQGVT